jgi:hypothetical protein
MVTYHGEDTSSRFAVLQSPVALPAKCAVCGTPQGPLLDFGLDIDMYGVVYFCLTCLEAAAARANLFEKYSVKSEQVRNDLQAYGDLKRRINEVRSNAESTASSINSFLTFLFDFSGAGFVVPETPVESEPVSFEPIEKPTRVIGQDGSDVVDEGPIELPSSTNNGPKFSFGT